MSSLPTNVRSLLSLTSRFFVFAMLMRNLQKRSLDPAADSASAHRCARALLLRSILSLIVQEVARHIGARTYQPASRALAVYLSDYYRQARSLGFYVAHPALLNLEGIVQRLYGPHIRPHSRDHPIALESQHHRHYVAGSRSCYIHRSQQHFG